MSTDPIREKTETRKREKERRRKMGQTGKYEYEYEEQRHSPRRSITGNASTVYHDDTYVGNSQVFRELTGERDPALLPESPEPVTIEGRRVHSVLRVAGSLRADVEYREQAKSRLAEAHSNGRLDDAVYSARLAAVDKAETIRQIEQLLLDLPAPPAPEEPEPKKRPPWRNPAALVEWATEFFGEHWERLVAALFISFAVFVSGAVTIGIAAGNLNLGKHAGLGALTIGGLVFCILGAICSLAGAIAVWVDNA
jgi:Domain of unknown function (DUF1707)